MQCHDPGLIYAGRAKPIARRLAGASDHGGRVQPVPLIPLRPALERSRQASQGDAPAAVQELGATSDDIGDDRYGEPPS